MTTQAAYHWWSDSMGIIELQIPAEAVRDCSHQGQCDEDVAYWFPRINWHDITRDQMERSLKEVGAWDDLQTVDLDTLKQRICWIACCDLAEESRMEEPSSDPLEYRAN